MPHIHHRSSANPTSRAKLSGSVCPFVHVKFKTRVRGSVRRSLERVVASHIGRVACPGRFWVPMKEA